MFLRSYCLLFLVYPFLAFPAKQNKERSFQAASLSGEADYPDLTKGLSDADVQESLNDLTLEDLRSLDTLLNEHINQREHEGKTSIRRHSIQSNKKSFRVLDPALDNGCREEEDCDEPKPVGCSKRPTRPSSKKHTSAPKTTRTAMRPTHRSKTKSTSMEECRPKSTSAPKDDFRTHSNSGECRGKTTSAPKEDFRTDSSFDPIDECRAKPTSGPNVKSKTKCKKPKEDIECEADDFQCLARMQMEKNKNVLRELDIPLDDIRIKYAQGRELAAIEKMNGRIPRPINYPQDDGFNFKFTKKSSLNEQPSELQGNQVSWKQEPLPNLEQGNHGSFKREYQPNWELQHEANFKETPQANFQQDNAVNLQEDEWANEELAKWKNAEKDHWAKVAAQDHDFNINQKEYENFEMGKQMGDLQPTQEQLVKYHQENEYKFDQDKEKNNPAKLDPYEQEYLAILEQRNKGLFGQNNHQVHDNQADLNWNHLRQQSKAFEHQLDLNLQNQAIMQCQLQRELRSEVDYQPSNQHWLPNQPLRNLGEFNKMEADPYQGPKLPCEKQNIPMDVNRQFIMSNDEAQQVNADLPKQETHFDGDSFLTNSARNPLRYLGPMQNNFIQMESEQRLNEDRIPKEGLNLDKLAGEKEAIPTSEADWMSDSNRGKRENRETNDAPENSKESYIKKLMDSFPRDQGGQINADVALWGWQLAHERIKRS